ncbi:PREDICTED: protein DEFECTIVE IN MERISTEM SILENCING 3-like isoform X2 [Ipomoea nil]|uniref:protein DEFECTIVE IN MERISTEM SILENCING 3-like isoform X2 n=1 Tax=Ipomoea nil TaxID=35883 RepID=UPI000901AADC|nr:PREDICTED: protein DEFECTIVE IN MERISTEM SILENCING 3-like isoform X2 [Ipomoea nil]
MIGDEQFQMANNAKALVVHDTSMLNHVGQNNSSAFANQGMQNGILDSPAYKAKICQDALQETGLRVKQHEENMKFLKTKKNRLDDSIIDLQVALGKHHSAAAPKIENDQDARSEEETVKQIMRSGRSAAAVLCHLKTNHGTQASNIPLSKDVLGIVATLGRVEDDNLSRILSDYLGLETMLAVVCKTYDGVLALETYDKEGLINKNSGLHGLGASIGQPLDGRFLVICLENLSPFTGDFIADDPQRRLDLLKPKLPNGESPPGFIGFAVNMINVDSMNVFCVTGSGHGLRETLFYNLFSNVQVYKTRLEMLRALPCISTGAVSLDGGMIKTPGIFSLGNRDVGVKFPKSFGRPIPPQHYFQIENKLKETKWEKERIMEDMQRVQALLDHARFNFEVKKQEFIKHLAQSSSYQTQMQI